MKKLLLVLAILAGVCNAQVTPRKAGITAPIVPSITTDYVSCGEMMCYSVDNECNLYDFYAYSAAYALDEAVTTSNEGGTFTPALDLSNDDLPTLTASYKSYFESIGYSFDYFEVTAYEVAINYPNGAGDVKLKIKMCGKSPKGLDIDENVASSMYYTYDTPNPIQLPPDSGGMDYNDSFEKSTYSTERKVCAFYKVGKDGKPDKDTLTWCDSETFDPVDSSLVKPCDPKSEILLAAQETKCVTLGWANINADGTLADACGDVTVAVDATGRRTLTPPAGALTAQISIVEAFVTRDSITPRLEDFIGQTIHLTEGDNGGTANTPRDRAFTILWSGEELRPTSLQSATNAELKPVNCSEYAEGFLDTTDIHSENGNVTEDVQSFSFASATVEGGWTQVGNVFTYTGSPKIVELDFSIFARDTGVSNYWAKPRAKITELTTGRIWWVSKLAMQNNTAYDGSIALDGSFKHLNPPANPSYRLEWSDEENRTATLTPQAGSSVVFEAVNQRSALVTIP